MHPAWLELVEDSEAGLIGQWADGLHSQTDLMQQKVKRAQQRSTTHSTE